MEKSKKKSALAKDKKQIRALVLFSGGLDSTLAVKLLEAQNIKVDIINFSSLFFCTKQAKETAKVLGKDLRIHDASKAHLEVIKNPKFGYGRAINPCTDCHLLMIREAKKILEDENYDIIATGEVLGQRPKSQKLNLLKLIEKEADMEGRILRPLSAQILEETIYEKAGLVDRKKLLDISGRSRKKQLEMIKKFKVKDYPNPAGGCILTDKNFAEKLKTIINNKELDRNDINLLRNGRFFNELDVNIIIGRNNEENEKILELARPKDILMEAKDITGPLTIIRSAKKLTAIKEKEVIKKAAELIKYYSTKTRDLDKAEISYWHTGKKEDQKSIIIKK